MAPFSLRVQLKGMNAFVPNSSYNEMMALMVNPESHHHDPAEPHLPHHLYLVFDCRELVGCSSSNLPPGFEPYPNPSNWPEWEHLVRYKLAGGYDIYFLLLPGEQEMPRRELKIRGISSDSDNEDPPQTPQDFRQTIDFEKLHAGAGKIKEGLVTLQVAPNLRELVSGRALLTKGDLWVPRLDPYGKWIFKPKGSSSAHHAQRFSAAIRWQIDDIDADALKVRATSFAGSNIDFVIRPNPHPGKVDVWIVNQPELDEWREYERALGVNTPADRPIPYDPHFKGFFSLCETTFDSGKLPIPHKPEAISGPGPGNEPIICPNPRGRASSAVGTLVPIPQSESDEDSTAHKGQG